MSVPGCAYATITVFVGFFNLSLYFVYVCLSGEKICFSVKIALFEVERDLRDPMQFVLVPAEECIGDIIGKGGGGSDVGRGKCY